MADDGGRGKAERADAELDGGGVDILLSLDALVDVVRTDDGDALGSGVPFPFFSGVAGLTLIAEVRFTFRAPR